MLNSKLFQNEDLPYQPLPQAAYDAARISLLKLNFPENAILDDYSFSSHSKEHTIKINALAFAHPIHRNPAEYAAFTLYNAMNGQRDEALVPILAGSSAPFHLIHRENQFSFWASAFRNNNPEPILVKSDIPYNELDEVLSNYAVDLTAQRIIDVKQGRDTFTLPIFRDIFPLQLSLWAADVTRDLLVDHFAQAVEVLRRHARQRPDTRAYDLPVTSLAIQLLGAIILADTGVLGNDLRLNDVTLSRLIMEAHTKFDTYFQLDLFDTYSEAAEEAYRLLRSIRYAGFVPEMLSETYTRAYSKEQRKKLGRFDTPLYLTRRIWENIPVEYLPPQKRYIADLTCGWGSFLIAGYERLSNLSDTQTHLREYLRGNDIDPFTAKLAGLGLLLSTSEDSWNIDHQDALEWSWLDTHQPDIIVGNPPFGANRKDPLIGIHKRYHKADDFLKYALQRLAPSGYLAMLMPRSFTIAEASPELRKQLLESCDLLELWELPTEVFPPDVAVRTVVVFAQKKAEPRISSQPVKVRTVQFKMTLDIFKKTGMFTASSLVVSQASWNKGEDKSKGSKNTHKLDYQIILPEHTWRKITSHCVDLSEQAQVISGVIIGQKHENKRWTTYEDPKPVRFLMGVKRVMKRPFFIDYSEATTIIYPNSLEEPRKDKEEILSGTKVLMVSDPDSTWGRRVRVAIERKNHYVSNSFWIIVPTSNAQSLSITHEVLAAILNWDVSNAWIIEYLKYPWIPVRAIKTIPFPSSLSKDDCRALTEAVWKLEEAAQVNQPPPIEVNQKIDCSDPLGLDT
jgi:N-6 DNA Methylase